MKNVITILAYKPNSDDYCMSCHMASYDSDFQFESFTEPRDAAQFMFNLQNRVLDTGESGYEFTTLVNGTENGYLDDENWEAYPETALVFEEFEKIKQQWEIDEAARKLAAEEAERQLIIANTARLKKAEEKREREEFERLKEKFEGTK